MLSIEKQHLPQFIHLFIKIQALQHRLKSNKIWLELEHLLGRVSYQQGLEPNLLTPFLDYAFKSLSDSGNLISFLALACKTGMIIFILTQNCYDA